MRYDAFIFDMDGVLLDTSRSFITAAVEAVAYATGTKRFTTVKVVRLKTIPGFNNDWHVAIAGACWIDYFPDISFQIYVEQLDRLGGGLKALQQLIPDLTPEYKQRLTRLTMEAYGGTTACQKLYGFEPESIMVPGYWQSETPLVAPEQIKPISKKAGIVTGRAEAELQMGFDRLGWSLPEKVVAWSDDPNLDKPNPIKLIRIINNLGAGQPVYIGDTRDDLELVKNYQQETGRAMDFCYIGSRDGIQDFDLNYRNVTEFLQTIGRRYG